jgi:multiple sugar transport system permease protein
MSAAQEALAVGRPVASDRRQPPARHRNLRGADFRWALAFVAPYVAVFLAFVVYPYGYALWMASSPALYADLIADPSYLPTVVNTLVFVGLGVNLKMFLAFLLSGFFMRRRWWIRGVLAVYVLPWAIATAQACVSFHWMLQGDLGLVNRLLSELFGVEGPYWFNHRWLALGSNIAAYIWKWMPFWTLIFLAARMKIPRELYDAAELDGATGYRRFVHVTVPLLANLYLLCTVLSTLWAIGDFTTGYLVSGGGLSGRTEVLATLGFRYAFDTARPELGVAVVMSALPVLIPLVIVLMRRARTSEVRL